jgi:DNA (cytosine-5)-methyltransferase 1
MVYYNDFEPAACEWLGELMNEGLIPKGDIDGRSVKEVNAKDLRGYSQCHFFAGIGGWPHALALAGVPSTTRLFTGSCPCQPFSTAGAQKGISDERHLFPAWMRLIRELKPPVILGEQVAAAVGHGWLDLVCTELEGEGYAVGSAILGAHSVGAPHIRQRLYWVADSSNRWKFNFTRSDADGTQTSDSEWRQPRLLSGGSSTTGDAANSESRGCLRVGRNREAASGLGIAITGSSTSTLGHANYQRPRGSNGGQRQENVDGRSFWDQCEWLPCSDGKARPVEPGTFPLANGIPRRLELLEGYGNAIVPQVAAEFIKAALL